MKHAGESVLVGPAVYRGGDVLFRSHVGWGADCQAGGGELVLGQPLPHCPRDAEVGDERVTAREQDVGWLDVAMDDAVLVRVSESPPPPDG
jgi:hypothetical protein